MKALRVYFVMALVWVTAGLSLVACSDKKSNGPQQQCQSPMIMQNGYCSYDPNNPGNGYPPGSGYYSPNGTQQNGSKFRDFTMLINQSYYRYYGTGENSLQIKVSGINTASATIYFSSPQLIYGTATFPSSNKFVDSGRNEMGFEIYHDNPYYRKVGELLFPGRTTISNTETSIHYQFIYFDNSSAPVVIMDGTLRKGMDY